MTDDMSLSQSDVMSLLVKSEGTDKQSVMAGIRSQEIDEILPSPILPALE
jgi:hypothetical protein